MPFAKWQARLNGEKVLTHPQPDQDDCGYYRLPIKEPSVGADGKTNGIKRTIGWTPVSYFMDGNELVCLAGDKEADGAAIWTYVVQNPISWEVYEAVAQKGQPWPDQPKPVSNAVSNATSNASSIPASNREVNLGDNQPPVVPADVQHKEAIENATKEPLGAITTEEQANAAQGRQNRVAELRLAASKAGEAVYKPLHAVYVAEQKKWSGIVHIATTFEEVAKKAILTFRESERKRIAAENLIIEQKRKDDEAALAAKAQEIEEANSRAADRAIGAGVPEPVPQVAPDLPPAPAPVALARVAPTYGSSRPREVEKLFVDQVTDWVALMSHFKDDAGVQAFFRTLAEKTIRTGVTVPGITTRRGLI